MTRQNSRPAKKKRNNTQSKPAVDHKPPMTLEVVIASPFTPSLPLKAQLRETRRSSNENKPHWQPHPGTIFSSGQCTIGTKKGRDTYTVRIKKPAAATSILNLPPGTRIHLKNAKFINSYGSKKYREISAVSYEIITEKPRITTSATPSIRWDIYPTEFGVKQKNGVILHKPLLLMTVSRSSSNK
jgi:hypothetical protein